MSTAGRFQSEVSQIESIAETKGIELDDIEVREGETDDGEELITFRILETKAESEEDSVGVQVSKMPAVQTGEMTFRNDVQNKMASLKKYLSGSQPSDEVDDEPEPDNTADAESDQTDEQASSRTRTRDTSRGDDGTGPGAELDHRIRRIEERLDDLEERFEEIEDKADALDGLQKLMGSDDDE